MKGAILIGNIPMPLYEDGEPPPYVCDLYLMDLDGTWVDQDDDGVYDGHEGDRELEIWVGRIQPPQSLSFKEQVRLVKRYIRKDVLHKVHYPNSALIYLDDKFVDKLDKIYPPVASIVANVTIVTDEETTNATDYLERIRHWWDIAHVLAHSRSTRQYFLSKGLWTYYSTSDLKNSPCNIRVLVLEGCFGCNVLADGGALGQWYIFGRKSSTLAVVGLTASSPFWFRNQLYADWQTRTIGDTFFTYMDYCIGNIICVGPYRPHYRYILLGDPTILAIRAL